MGLSTATKFYIGAFICAGFVLSVSSMLNWSSADHGRFLAYFLLTAIASGMKVRLPGVTGTISVSYVLLLSCIVQFSWSEVAAIAVISALVQCVWKATSRPSLIQLSFNTSVTIASAALAYVIYHAWPSDISPIFSITSAACAFFLINTVSVAGVIALTEQKSLIRTWEKSYIWSFPYYLVGASIALSMSYLTKLNWEIGLAILPVIFLIYRSYTLHLRQLEAGKRQAETVAALHVRTIETLAFAIEAKDQTTAAHLKRVQIYTGALCQGLGLSEDEKLALHAASILHDVGKIAVPDYIISKPGRLTPEEFDRMKIHPIVGAEIVERIGFPYPVAPIVRAHHEKWDGSGYPFGLEGDQIPMGARILSVVDCFDALASDRQYRKALPLEQAMAIIAGQAGKSFDRQIVELLGQRYVQLEQLAQAQPVPDPPKLSLHAKVERGPAPAVGFEAAAVRDVANRFDPRDQLATAHDKTRAFDEFTSTLGISLSSAETLGIVCSRVNALVPADAVSVYLMESSTLVPRYVHGENFKVLSSLRIRLGEGVAGWVAENHMPILNGDPMVEPGYCNGPACPSPLNSVLAVPLQTDSGTIGVLALYRAPKDAFSREDMQDLMAVSSRISVTIENSRLQEYRTILENVDVITGLPNGRTLSSNIEAEIGKRRASNATLTVLLCALEGVAGVHESFGRVAADQALRAVARRFRDSCREVDYLGRRGSDEFVFVLPGLSANAVDGRISALNYLVREAGRELWGSDLLSLSSGAATFPSNGSNAEVLVAEAENRMFAARRLNVWENFNSTAEDLVHLSRF